MTNSRVPITQVVSLNFSSRVMLFCLDGVTHDGSRGG